MRRLWRLWLVTAVASLGFVLAVVRFDDAAADGCAQRVREDRTYRARFDETPSTAVARYRLAVSRGGRPVSGAAVCLTASMRGMSAMAVADRGTEVAPGSYAVSLTFEMGGRWSGRVLVSEGGGTVAVPLELLVLDPAPPART